MLTCEIIVIDNASTDGSAEAVAQEFPSVLLIRNANNNGFAVANNQGIKKATGKYLLLLNPDTLLIEDAITPLFEFMEHHPEAGIAGCKILNQDGSLQPSYFPFLNLAMLSWIALFLDRLIPLNYINGKWVVGSRMPQTPFRVQRLLGAFLFVRREVFQKVGLMDEGYFLFCEEEDFCYRAYRQGWAIYCFPQARIIHLGGKSAAQNRPATVIHANASRVRFFSKHYGIVTELLFRVIWLFALLVRMPSVLKLPSSERRAMINAYAKAMAGLLQPLSVGKLHGNIVTRLSSRNPNPTGRPEKSSRS
jgi:hypothetical protein